LQHSYGIACGTCIPRDATIDCLRKTWRLLRDKIRLRLDEFRQVWLDGSEENIFAELAFCLFTPQSKARNCWSAVNYLFTHNLLLAGNAGRISAHLQGVRFHHTKAARLVMARRQFTSNGVLNIRSAIEAHGNVCDTRDWLADNVLGIGYKEASHFLRNIGFYKQSAILDRHILRNLKRFGVIDEVPDTLTRRKYLAIEQQMKDFARSIKIPASGLDLLLWCRETGEIFK